MPQPLQLYTCFHLNMAFSSVEGHSRPEIVKKCYWPLLHIAQTLRIPIGIEASASTLEMITQIDPSWTALMRELIAEGLISFVGSGYVQLIGPLVPSGVNRANLRLGHVFYEELLGTRPTIALINEQAYSPGLLPLYREAGYDAFMMDWANPYSTHEDWDPELLFRPQRVRGAGGEVMNVVWSHSIPFQKFQRVVYRDMTMDDYLAYLAQHQGKGYRAFPLYCSDAEVFDFRPGRYRNEETSVEGEWDRIHFLLERLRDDPRFAFATPAEIGSNSNVAGEPLTLETPHDPIPVKKQPKYNVTRWASSGRDDTWINTACWRLYKHMQAQGTLVDEGHWRHLCLMWRSDYRTHITDTRWKVLCGDVMDELVTNNLLEVMTPQDGPAKPMGLDEVEGRPLGGFNISRNAHFLRVECEQYAVVFNLRRGMAISSFVVPEISQGSLFGTLEHGYFTDISWSSDFYSGHLVAEIPGAAKVCDLEEVDPECRFDEDLGVLQFRFVIPTQLGDITKYMSLHTHEPRVDIYYKLDWENPPPGNLRIAHVTLNPQEFDIQDLSYRTHNGGDHWEQHSLREGDVDMGRAVSFFTSAQSGLGMTNGVLHLSDGKKTIELRTDKTQAATIGLVTCKKIGNSYFCRMGLSAREMDDTARQGSELNIPGRNHYNATIRVLTAARAEAEGADWGDA